MQQNQRGADRNERNDRHEQRNRVATVASVLPGKGGELSVDGGASGVIACVRGPEQGIVLTLLPGSYTIGRARENDFVLKDIAASRKHLRIEVDGDVVRLVDLGSGNGTRVNGKRAGELELSHGDSIEIGGSVLVYSQPGRTTTVAPEVARGEAQARVVAAADELARELSSRLRFGDENASEGVDGHRAKTRALRTADARAVAEELAKQQAAREAAEQQQQSKASKRGNERLWNETFTNMPLSAVVPDEQRLQGTARDLPQKPQRPRAPTPPPMFVQPLPTGPMGTAVDVDDESRWGPPPQQQQQLTAPSSGSSFLQSVLMSAGAVVIIGALVLGISAIFFGDEPVDERAAAAAAERDTEYGTAIARAQDAFAKQDWATMREYAGAALQVRPGDQLAASYKRDAELRLEQAPKAVPAPTTTAPPPPTTTTTAPTAAPTPVEVAKPAPVEVKPAEAKPVVKAAPPAPEPERAPQKPKPSTKPSSKKTMSDDEAKSRFERAIDAFRSKDNDTGCKLLNQVADRAPAESTWRGKADALFMKRCGD